MVRDDRTSGILIVDELSSAVRHDLHQRLAATNGRWQLLAIEPLTATHRVRGPRDILVEPLDGSAIQALVVAASGLDESHARHVADVAGGFPELAFRLASELQLDPSLDLYHLAHLDRPNELLERALPDADLRDALKPLALFTGLGVDGDLGYQLDEVAAAFGRDPAQVRHVIERELSRNRFVSAAGRYRSVSPTLVAIWLAAGLIEDTPELDQIINSLPEPVQEAFYSQLELFGPGADQLGSALAKLLEDNRFRDPSSFDGAAGRLLRASAAVVPSQVADNISQLVRTASPEQLRAVPRRDLIWALQVLLWWPETWEQAIEALFAFAAHETETWSNNASGVFADAFAVYLSGSTVPFSTRIDWLRRAVAEGRTETEALLIRAAAKGLAHGGHRSVVGFRGGGEPLDWQPETVADLRDARAASWQLLFEFLPAATDDDRPEVVSAIEHGLWTMVQAGLVDEVDSSIRSAEWTSSERSALMGVIQRLLRLEAISAEVQQQLSEARDWLAGASDVAQLATVLATPTWNLHENTDAMLEDPPVLVALADRFSTSPDTIRQAIETGRSSAQPNTRFRFLTLLARRVGSEALAVAIAQDEDFDLVAASAAIATAEENHEDAWVDEYLGQLAAGQHGSFVPHLVTYASVTDDRIRLALDVVEQGRASADALANLRGGGRFAELSEPLIADMLVALANANAAESALGMLLQLVEARGNPTGRLKTLSSELALQAVGSEHGDPMLDYYVTQLLKRGIFDDSEVTALWASRVRNREGLVEELDHALTERLIEDIPEEALGAALQLVRDEAAGDASFSLFASRDLAILSRVAAKLGVDAVWQEVAALTEHQLRIAIHHMRWAGTTPDPLVRRFLTSSRFEGYESEAASCFFNTLGTVSGHYWIALARELERARSWLRDLHGTSAEEWARNLVDRYERDVKSQRQRDEEERFRLGY
ncbi:hypothetical protein LRS13_08345 [Svornostia abyssi]|uniref:ATP-binding protein n=1 Tax=Svornostia abyssi TaxID=2898438 RepID=A0ABY5PLF0_9ACTN|nr:hypothetical protein LRS13_08345 [Parviterribacteraceae bacterium J379]